MKLYATTTSERASKGQGGNERIHITIQNEQKEIIAVFLAIPYTDKGYRLIYDYDEAQATLERSTEGLWNNTKGEKQQTAKCNDCTEGVTEYETIDGECSWCGRTR